MIIIQQRKNGLTAFDDMIADMEANQKLNLLATELSIRGRKLNISLFCITILFQST